MPTELKRKTREKPAPYKPRQKPMVHRDGPATSAITKKRARDNLTLHDWMTVLAFVDAHPNLGQADIVNHFKTRRDGILTFIQSTLSRKLKMETELAARIQAHPNALSSKRP